MLIIKLQGGLGNQMFQYAAARSLATALGVELKLDVTSALGKSALERSVSAPSYLLNSYDIDAKIANSSEISDLRGAFSLRSGLSARIARYLIKNNNYLLRRVFSFRHRYLEKDFRFNTNYFSLADNMYLEGYFQSERYFHAIKDEIRVVFSNPVGYKKYEQYFDRFTVKNREAVAVGVRRGEFVSDRKTNSYHGACSAGYYYDAIQRIFMKVEKPLLIFFSDDISWCKSKFSTVGGSVFVEDNLPPQISVKLFSRCQYSIISNSSFFWWGAWLNNSPKKIVVAPKIWFNVSKDTSDLLPDSWIRI